MQSLASVLDYQNRYIIREFLRKHPHYNLSQEQAQTVFDDMKRYLWLSDLYDKHRKDDPETPDITISVSMIIIDEMWHEFILVTEHYTDFCQKYFGRYLHHPPYTKKYDRNAEKIGAEAAKEIFLDELLGAVYDNLGEEVTLRWFDTYRQYLPAEEMSHHF